MSDSELQVEQERICCKCPEYGSYVIFPGKLTCTLHSSDGVRLGVSRRLAVSKMFLMDVDVDVDTTDNVPIMVD